MYALTLLYVAAYFRYCSLHSLAIRLICSLSVMDHSKFALTLDDGDLGETVAGGSFARRSVRVCGAQCVARRLDDLAARGELGEEDWQELLSRLDSACQLLSSLRHPNLVLFVGVHGEGTRDVAIVTERLFIDLERFISCYSSGAKLSLKLQFLLLLAIQLLLLVLVYLLCVRLLPASMFTLWFDVYSTRWYVVLTRGVM